MEVRWDFIDWLGPDISTRVLSCLDDPADLVRASTVSRSWHHFVIAYGFLKNLLSRLYPEIPTFVHVIEQRCQMERNEVGPSNSTESESLEKEHRVYSLLAQHLNSYGMAKNCYLESIAASSTDNYPQESIVNTLDPSDRVNTRPSYWSSTGTKDPTAPETLTYRLRSNLSVVEQINIRPFQAFFQYGDPIYSACAVRFRMGATLLPPQRQTNSIHTPLISQQPFDSEYIWSYASPTYPMLQENILQSFKLPRPTLCVGGILQVELLGRVQKQEMDGLYYICVGHVQVVGRSLSPTFDVDVDDRGGFVLKCSVDAMENLQTQKEGCGLNEFPSWQTFIERIRDLRAGRGWNEMGRMLRREALDDDSDEEA